jgi:hypothetical protein
MRKGPGPAPSNSQVKPMRGADQPPRIDPSCTVDLFRLSPANRSLGYHRWIQSTDGGCKRVLRDRLGEDTGSHCGALVRPTPPWPRTVVLGRSCPSFRAGPVRRQGGCRYCPTLVRRPRVSKPVSPSRLKSPPHPQRSRISSCCRRRISGEMPRPTSGRQPYATKQESLLTFPLAWEATATTTVRANLRGQPAIIVDSRACRLVRLRWFSSDS